LTIDPWANGCIFNRVLRGLCESIFCAFWGAGFVTGRLSIGWVFESRVGLTFFCVQGNVVTKEQAAQVQVGQTRTQVREMLGSPLLTDVFHANRWDWVFTLRRPGTAIQKYNVVAVFEGDVLKSLEGTSALPSEREFVNAIDALKTPKKDTPLSLTESQRQALKLPIEAPVAASSASEAVGRVYPPLER
jgi:outer membrane protein assembly factor BamE